MHTQQASIENMLAAFHGPLFICVERRVRESEYVTGSRPVNLKLKEKNFFSTLEERRTCKAPAGLQNDIFEKLMLYQRQKKALKPVQKSKVNVAFNIK